MARQGLSSTLLLTRTEPVPVVRARLCSQQSERPVWPSYSQRLMNSVGFREQLIAAITSPLRSTMLTLHIYSDYEDGKYC